MIRVRRGHRVAWLVALRKALVEEARQFVDAIEYCLLPLVKPDSVLLAGATALLGLQQVTEGLVCLILGNELRQGTNDGVECGGVFMLRHR